MSKSKYPEQTNPTAKERRAIAPYNFIQIPEQVIAAEDARVKHDTYHAGRHTGQITATLRAVSPLYTRTGLTPEDFAAISGKSFSELLDKKQRYAEFFQLNGVPTIPGSSLRGMLRTLIEIVTQSKLTRVMRDGLVYRAVGDTSSLGIKYRARLMREDRRKYFTPIMQAGYIQKQGNQWFIRPAKNIAGTTFCRMEINSIPRNLKKWNNSQNASEIWVKPSPPDYQSIRGGFIHIWFSQVQVSSPTEKTGFHKAVLCRSGSINKKRHEMVVFEPDQSAILIPIDDEMLFSYREQISKEQQNILGKDGVLVHNQPVFYLVEDGTLVFFGHAFLFRIPYLDAPLDFVPQELRDPTITDIAEAMFGYVPDDKRNDTRQAYAGRVFVDDAVLVEEQRGPDSDVWLNLNGQAYLVPQILGSPKPTTFQHYLVQQQENRRDLKHYASTPVEETVIRGHKLYWHKGMVSTNDIKHPDVTPGKEGTQHTGMRPVKPDTRFALSIRFENLSDVELGALLWLLQLASDGQHALKLGMGKPLGLGSVQLEGLTVYVANRRARYTTLFDETGNWATGAAVWDADRQRQCVDAFQQYIADHSGVTGKPSFEQLPRTQQLRCMLAWPGPKQDDTRYMEIERKESAGYVCGRPRNGKVNEYADRPILPRPDALCSGGQRTPTAAQSEQQRPVDTPEQPRPVTKQPVAKPEMNPTSHNKPTTAPALPQIGSTFTGTVVDIKQQVVAIEIPNVSTDTGFAIIEAEHFGTRTYHKYQMARVEVIGIEERKGRTILKVKPAPKN